MSGKRVTLYLATLALCASVAWFASSPDGWLFDWRAFVAVLTTLAGFVTAELVSAPTAETVRDQNDRTLVAALRAELPRSSAIELFERGDFLVDFEAEPVRTLERFRMTWNNEEHKFFDRRLDRARRKLLEAAHDCLSLIGKYATSENEGRVFRIRTMNQRHSEKFEAMWREQAGEIHAFAKQVVKHYDEIVRRGRRRFPDQRGG